MDKVGKDGVITVEEAKGMETILEIVEGMQFDRGYLSPYFVTDPDRMEAVLENPLILLHEKKISNLREMLPLLEKRGPDGQAARHHGRRGRGRGPGDARRQQAARARSICAAVKAPGFGDRRKAMLEDIAILTGGKVITEDIGVKLENVDVDWLGEAKKVVIDKDNTTIVEGKGKDSDIQARIKQIRTQIDETTSDYDREKLQERLAKMVGGVAVIKVGAATETELKEKKARVEDALHATRAAVEEGIVPGGGVALLRSQKALDGLKLEGDEKVGADIVRRALEEPLRQIATNAGLEGSIVVEKVKEMKARHGLQRRDREVRRHGQGRNRRPDQGRPDRPAERRLDRRPHADDRGPHRRASGRGKEARVPDASRRHVLSFPSRRFFRGAVLEPSPLFFGLRVPLFVKGGLRGDFSL